jgi:signal transduction histidine kinase
MYRRSAVEMRVFILAPIGRDAALLSDTLAARQIDTGIAADRKDFLQMLAEGAGCAIITDEALTADTIPALTQWLASQPNWSDPPFIILTAGGSATRESHHRAQEIQMLGNCTLIERPARPDTIQSAVRSALRARMRQYEIRSRQEELLQANADLEQFAHSASHDLKEPIRSIGIYSELLAKDEKAVVDEKGREFLELIRSSARRMDELLSDLLAYAHASTIAEEAFEPAEAQHAVTAALENLSGAIRESDADITIGDLPRVRMRETHLSQIFQNLIGNAIKYRCKDNRLTIAISAEKTGRHWTFRVADNGIGIAPQYRETIFGIFKRLHSNREYSGTGMGLAICQRIVERYQGRIWVEPELRKGSTFLFTVPE